MVRILDIAWSGSTNAYVKQNNEKECDEVKTRVLSGVELVDPEGLDTTWFPVSSLQEMGQEGIF